MTKPLITPSPRPPEDRAHTQVRIWTSTLEKLRELKRLTGIDATRILDVLVSEELTNQQAQQKGDK